MNCISRAAQKSEIKFKKMKKPEGFRLAPVRVPAAAAAAAHGSNNNSARAAQHTFLTPPEFSIDVELTRQTSTSMCIGSNGSNKHGASNPPVEMEEEEEEELGSISYTHWRQSHRKLIARHQTDKSYLVSGSGTGRPSNASSPRNDDDDATDFQRTFFDRDPRLDKLRTILHHQQQQQQHDGLEKSKALTLQSNQFRIKTTPPIFLRTDGRMLDSGISGRRHAVSINNDGFSHYFNSLNFIKRGHSGKNYGIYGYLAAANRPRVE
ncbi:hypothetical protein DAPPUDRAFT_236960 [Daphnia pulex]|uniref:Uncharacterized protein n=1 Tax=Daphnia pulex TaxID=6669 RepID=E9G2D4_DAPPU|nr:hypothetical protein DAPPUDRAFT_236960 [Daphnia pulex]|eukprot:EFX86329.1 hypothetical protein DAPPUDRAFT_236960 [Daphnia pulex]